MLTLDKVLASARAAARAGAKVAQRRYGIEARNGRWAADARGACGLGLAMVGLPAADNLPPDRTLGYIAAALGITENEAGLFEHGFDLHDMDDVGFDDLWFAAGRTLYYELTDSLRE